ncbi:MAG: hypothetical protein SFY69_11900 [Planctomycetota bacterium]|nr:hypothetical protein [Planctomycetota bacterium]
MFRAVLSREVVGWLRARPALVEPFAAALGRVRSGVDLGEPIKEPGSKYLLRFFRFGRDGSYIAVFVSEAATRTVRVVTCRSVRPEQP